MSTKKIFSYKVCNVTTEYTKDPFAFILAYGKPVGHPLSLNDVYKVINWLHSITEEELDQDEE